jgi:leucyl/phenylalanyl-tRNA--protein transferase
MISTEDMFWAYRAGCFVMPDDEGNLAPFVAHRRAILGPQGVQISRSLRKTLNRADFEIRTDTAFAEVVHFCSETHTDDGCWLIPPLQRLLAECHREGWAHSVEVWRGGRLVGGVYGLAVGSVFCAESMFHLETDMGKVALVHLERITGELGFQLIDAQYINPLTARLGFVEIPRAKYEMRLKELKNVMTPWSFRRETVGPDERK